MEYISITIQAVIQGLTEFIPVSSSGHLSVLQHFIGIEEGNLLITIFLHIGTLLALFIAFRDTIFGMIKEFFLTFADIFTGRFSWKKMNDNRRMMFMIIIATAVLVPVYFFRDYFISVEGDGDIIFEGFAFIFTAIVLFLSDAAVKGVKTGKDMKLSDALVVGLFQCIALFPGVSRSGSTISGGIFCGLSRQTAVTFSFMMGIPAILGGSVLELREALSSNTALNVPELLIGLSISAVVGFFSIKLVSLLVKKDKFKIFGVYTLIIGILCAGWGIYEKITGNILIINI